MPIVIDTDGPSPPPSPPPVEVSVPAYRGVTVDTRYTPLSALIANIEGSPWSVQYYSQVLNVSNAPDAQQMQRAAALQQYKCIRNFELKVQGQLEYSQDESTKTSNYTGTSLAYPCLVPNKGDMFLADIGDGKEGVFAVSSVVPKSMYQQTVWEIQYEMVDYSTASRRADLDAKTISTYQFVKDFLQYGQNPLVLDTDFATLLDLQVAYPRTVQAWASEFFSTVYSTFMIPGQQSPSYDHWLTTTMMKWLTYEDVPQMIRARVLTCDGDEQMRIPTIWDVISAGDMQMMRRITEQANLVSVNIFSGDPMLEGVRYSGMAYVMYPLDPITTWDEAQGFSQAAMAIPNMLQEAPVRRSRLDDLIPNLCLDGLPYEGLPLIKDVTVDQFYIFSEAFYTRDIANQSRLERAVWEYLEGQDVDLNLLNTLLQSYQSWGGLERFYYTPIIAMLIKARIRII
jgi:hypothetical protein